jgi:hypothetical protein
MVVPVVVVLLISSEFVVFISLHGRTQLLCALSAC